MPFETADEIFELCKKILMETRHYVCYTVRSFAPCELFVTVDVKENGWEPNGEFDVTYGFFCNGKENDICTGMNEIEYMECKKRLSDMLEDNNGER